MVIPPFLLAGFLYNVLDSQERNTSAHTSTKRKIWKGMAGYIAFWCSSQFLSLLAAVFYITLNVLIMVSFGSLRLTSLPRNA